MTEPEVSCPLCHAPIPMARTDQPNSQGLSTGLDDRLVEEHIEMHRACCCDWTSGRLTTISVHCLYHGQADGVFIDPVQDLFPDVPTTEDETGHECECACNRNWGGPCGPCICGR